MAHKSTPGTVYVIIRFVMSLAVCGADGISVRINSKLLPPERITLPIGLTSGNPSNVMFIDYDFSLETKVVEWAEAHEQCKSAEAGAEERRATEMVGDAIESFSRGARTADKTAPSSTATSSHSSTSNHVDLLASTPIQEQLPEVPMTSSQSSNVASIFAPDGILQPIPLKSKQSIDGAKVEKNTSLNIRDFEQEEDPFENMELKVLNDMEELNKILGVPAHDAVVSTATPPPAAPEPPATMMDQSQGGNGNVTDLHGIDYPAVESISKVPMMTGHSFLPPLPANASLVGTSPGPDGRFTMKWNKKPVNNAVFNATHQSGTFHGNSWSTDTIKGNPWGSSSGNTLRSAKSTPDISQLDDEELFERKPPTSHTPPPCPPRLRSRSPPPAYTPSSSQIVTKMSTDNTKFISILTEDSDSDIANAKLDLEIDELSVHEDDDITLPAIETLTPEHSDFLPVQISKVEQVVPNFGNDLLASANAKAANDAIPEDDRIETIANTELTVSETGDVTMSSKHTASVTSFGGGVENSDDAAVLISGLRAVTYRKSRSTNHSPPPVAMDNDLATQHASDSAFASLQQWNPYTPLPPTATASPSTLTQQQRSSPSTLDPYRELDPQKQRFVDNITSMGFPRSRVIKVVQELGEDDKQVVDRLCVLDKLCEQGHTEAEAEAAVKLFNAEPQQAVQYLRLVSQFREFGFGESRVREVLLETKLDEERALDMLTTA